MEIKIKLPNWKCDNLLYLHDYITEEVNAYYSGDINPYEENGINTETLKSVKIKIAYPKMARPEELKKEYPMLHVLKEFEYEDVVNNIFNEHLWRMLVKEY